PAWSRSRRPDRFVPWPEFPANRSVKGPASSRAFAFLWTECLRTIVNPSLPPGLVDIKVRAVDEVCSALAFVMRGRSEASAAETELRGGFPVNELHQHRDRRRARTTAYQSASDRCVFGGRRARLHRRAHASDPRPLAPAGNQIGRPGQANDNGRGRPRRPRPDIADRSVAVGRARTGRPEAGAAGQSELISIMTRSRRRDAYPAVLRRP